MKKKFSETNRNSQIFNRFHICFCMSWCLLKYYLVCSMNHLRWFSFLFSADGNFYKSRNKRGEMCILKRKRFFAMWVKEHDLPYILQCSANFFSNISTYIACIFWQEIDGFRASKLKGIWSNFWTFFSCLRMLKS